MPERVPVRRTKGLLFPSFSQLLTEHALGFANSYRQQPSSGLSPYSYVSMPGTHMIKVKLQLKSFATRNLIL